MIRHILKDGREVESIEGFVVKAEDFPMVYETLEAMERGD